MGEFEYNKRDMLAEFNGFIGFCVSSSAATHNENLSKIQRNIPCQNDSRTGSRIFECSEKKSMIMLSRPSPWRQSLPTISNKTDVNQSTLKKLGWNASK